MQGYTIYKYVRVCYTKHSPIHHKLFTQNLITLAGFFMLYSQENAIIYTCEC